MERDRENLWTRRSKDNRPSLSMGDRDHGREGGSYSSRTFSSSNKRFGGDSSSHGRANPFNAVSPLNTNTTGPNPTSASSSGGFGLGTGAFASFGSAKTPKTPGSAIDFSKAASGGPTTPGGKKEGMKARSGARSSGTEGEEDGPSSLTAPASSTGQEMMSAGQAASAVWPIKYTWVIWYRPPTSKNSDYEKSIQPICKMSTAQEFWKVYVHLKHPSDLPTVSDYHFFKQGIRPVWEDEQNKRGGKWIMRLKKGVADRYWEDLLMAMVGDQFMEAGEEVCGMVLSVRSGEDVFSIWTKNDGGRNVKIRETIKRVLSLPADTSIIWKSHDDSIAQRSAIDQARQEGKAHHGHGARRVTLSAEDSPASKEKS